MALKRFGKLAYDLMQFNQIKKVSISPMRIHVMPLCICILAGALLSGCTYFQTEEELVVSSRDLPQNSAEQIELSVAEEEQMVLGAGINGAVDDMDLMELSNRVSSSSVDVYSFDAEQPEVPMPVKSTRSPYSYSPNVQIYPLDSSMRQLIAPDLRRMEPVRMAAPVPVVAEAAELDLTPGTQRRPLPVEAAVSRDSNAARVYFPHDSALLSTGQRQQLRTIAERYKNNPSYGLSVAGFSSERASIDSPVKRQIVNLKVSTDRAFSVARELIQQGVPADMIYLTGWGETHPSVPMDGLDAEAASRRVEITPYLVR